MNTLIGETIIIIVIGSPSPVSLHSTQPASCEAHPVVVPILFGEQSLREKAFPSHSKSATFRDRESILHREGGGRERREI